MAKPDVYRFPGSPTDVVVTLSHPAEKVVPEDPAPSDHEHARSNKNEFEERNGVSETVTTVTVFHLWSAVLKEQSKYFEAEMLRWSEQPPSSSCSWRGNLKCIDDLGPTSYALAFHAMYEAHHGESDSTLAQTEVKSVEDALKLLRVSSHLGFSTGVDAALFRIQAVPWTADEEASVAECTSLLQVPVSKGLAARLKTDLQSFYLNRRAVRGSLVESWKRSLLEWRNTLEKYRNSKFTSNSL